MQPTDPRDEATRLPALLAVGLGETAGVLFASAVLLALGGEVATRLAASVLLGSAALEPARLDVWGAITVALPVHVTLSALLAALHRRLHAAMPAALRVSARAQAVAGGLFGLLVYLVNVQLIARRAYPWFLDAPQLRLAALHALLFGLPLGLLAAIASRERARVKLAPAAPRPQVVAR